jgi:thioredoxin 1
MENVVNVTKESLDALISEGKTIIVDFWAEWCGPCRALGPILDKVAEENAETQIVKVNVDENPELPAEYGVRSIPAVFIYKDGKQTGKFVGVKSKEDIQKML